MRATHLALHHLLRKSRPVHYDLGMSADAPKTDEETGTLNTPQTQIRWPPPVGVPLTTPPLVRVRIPKGGRFVGTPAVVQTIEDLTARKYVEGDPLDLDYLSTRDI